jgi:hypothetical protein
VLKQAHAPCALLPTYPPAEPGLFRQVTRDACLAILDFDQGALATSWHRALRAQRPSLPIVALFSHADLLKLLPAGTLGLEGALQLPCPLRTLTAFLSPWLPAPPRLSPSRDSLEHTSVPFAPRTVRHPATHLAPASDANQRILHTLAEHPLATRFVARGPRGAEFTLLALEIASRHHIEENDIAFDTTPLADHHRLLVTRQRARFHAARTPLALLLRAANDDPDETPLTPSASPLVTLEFLPLHRRLPDVAYYLNRWLPRLAAASHPGAVHLPLSPAWRHALLAHPWSGDFAELWNALQRFALLTPDASPPADFFTPLPDANPPVFSFEALLAVAGPRAYRTRLARRIPVGLLPAVAAALGCPDLPPGHE